jgi:hypothetical protein
MSAPSVAYARVIARRGARAHDPEAAGPVLSPLPVPCPGPLASAQALPPEREIIKRISTHTSASATESCTRAVP